jgi:hypothetical protein
MQRPNWIPSDDESSFSRESKFCVVHLDVLIYSQTADEHLEHIRLVLRGLQRYMLHIKLSKCYF